MSNDAAAIKNKKQHEKLLKDGIFFRYPEGFPIDSRVPNVDNTWFGVCPLCVGVGKNTAICYQCKSVSTFQLPMVYKKYPEISHHNTYIKTGYRVDSLFYAVHMSIYDRNDPGYDNLKDYTSRDPVQILVTPEKQGPQLCEHFLNELPTTLPYRQVWFDRAYPDPGHERRGIMESLMTDRVSSIFEEEPDVNGNPVYVRQFEDMIKDWKDAILQIRRSTEHSLEFLSLTGTGCDSDSEDSDDEGEGEDDESEFVTFQGNDDGSQGAAKQEKKKQKTTN